MSFSPNKFVRLYREEIRRDKAQLKLATLATTVKDNLKYFYKHINKKRSSKENLHILLDAGGNIVTRGKG